MYTNAITQYHGENYYKNNLKENEDNLILYFKYKNLEEKYEFSLFMVEMNKFIVCFTDFDRYKTLKSNSLYILADFCYNKYLVDKSHLYFHTHENIINQIVANENHYVKLN